MVRFEVAPAPDVADPGANRDLDDDDVAEIDVRLQRMDAGRPRPWTRAVLRSLAESPGTRSAELSEQLGIDQARLKSDIRRLKRLGLTRSLERGYELSPRVRPTSTAECRFRPGASGDADQHHPCG